MGLTVQAKASHTLWEILILEMYSSNSSYMTFPLNTDPTAVSMASVASLEVSQMGTLLRDMWQSSRFSHQLTSSLAQLDMLTIFLAEASVPMLVVLSTIHWISLDLALVRETAGLEE